jgi:hypothetical protein
MVASRYSQTLYAGAEHQGLYRSVDRGESWQKVELPVSAINALVISLQDGRLLAATDTGLYGSDDQGQRWACLLDRPSAFSLAVGESTLVTGLVNQGAWLSYDQTNWQPCFTLPARALTGMALSPHFDLDLVGFLYGAQEGLWRT